MNECLLYPEMKVMVVKVCYVVTRFKYLMIKSIIREEFFFLSPAQEIT